MRWWWWWDGVVAWCLCLQTNNEFIFSLFRPSTPLVFLPVVSLARLCGLRICGWGRQGCFLVLFGVVVGVFVWCSCSCLCIYMTVNPFLCLPMLVTPGLSSPSWGEMLRPSLLLSPSLPVGTSGWQQRGCFVE